MKTRSAFLLFLLPLLFFASCNQTSKSQSQVQKSKNQIWEVREKNYSLDIEFIDSIQFYVEKSKTKPVDTLQKITDFATAKKMLTGVVEFREHQEYKGLRRILFRNGGIYNSPYDEEGFVAYYPSEDIILFEGGHSSDVSFDLKDGRETEIAGNPDLMYNSPQKTVRLNGYYPGQECDTYFIQKKMAGRFENIIPLSEVFEKREKTFLCHIPEAFWQNEEVLYMKEVMFWEENKHVTKYYKITLINTNFEPVKEAVWRSKNPFDFIPEGYKLFKDEYPAEGQEDGLIKGDLNKDGLEDVIMLIKGTDTSMVVKNTHGKMVDRNRRGIIILFNKKDHYELGLKNYTCFTSENEEGGVYFPPDLGIMVERGNLKIHYAHGRYGHWVYTFTYRNRDFEMIGYDESSNHGPVVLSETSINFLPKKKLTRKNINQAEDDGGEEVFEDTWEDISLEELTRLSEIRNFEEFDVSEAYSKP